jgi:hypothetical protein
MAIPATDLRLIDISIRLLAKSRDLDTPLEGNAKWAHDAGLQFQEFAGVGACNLRNRARLAQVCRPFFPGYLQKSTLLDITAAIIIAIKVRALISSRGFHGSPDYVKKASA